MASQPVGVGSLCNRSWDLTVGPGTLQPTSSLHCTLTKLLGAAAPPAERFVEQLNIQIGHEFAAHQQYVACAVYYDALTMPQMAGFFYEQALEERNHAMMMITYLIDQDAHALVPGVSAPQADLTSSPPSNSRSSRSAE